MIEKSEFTHLRDGLETIGEKIGSGLCWLGFWLFLGMYVQSCTEQKIANQERPTYAAEEITKDLRGD